MQEKNLRLTTKETMIMNAIWSAEKEISIKELIQKLEDISGKKYARTTIVTFLGKIMAKGLVETKRNGKEAYVHALVPKEECFSYAVNEFSHLWSSISKDTMLSEFQNLK